ncbi:hypothetical protein HYR69_08420, partial [Candidatus Sumerlaeota bacterium]|nr:hypothetical protein [Candidatus Sumerlaeota bacterium]
RPRVLDDLEKLAGNSSIRRWCSLTAAPLRGAIVAAAVLSFILAMCEAHASILLVTPGQETLAIRTYTLLHFAPDSLVAGLCLISLGVMIAGSSFLLIAARLLPDPLRKGRR